MARGITEKEGYIYLLRNPAWEYIKVGASQDPAVREKDANTWCPLGGFEMIHTVFVPRASLGESVAHMVLDKYRMSGEWFAVKESVAIDVLDKIQSVFEASYQVDHLPVNFGYEEYDQDILRILQSTVNRLSPRKNRSL